MAADCLKSMLTRLSKPDRDPLFDIITVWLKDKQITHRRLAAQLCGILVTVEKTQFESRIPTLMPLIKLQFGLTDETTEHKPGKFVLLKPEQSDEDLEKELLKDHHLFQVLQMLEKLCASCPAFLKQDVESIAAHAQTLLAHAHEWVRLAAAEFLGFVLAATDIKRLSQLLTLHKSDASGYLYSNPAENIRTLTLDLCAQLQPNLTNAALAEQAIKNLIFVARVLQSLPVQPTEQQKQIDLPWLVRRMRKTVNTEVVIAPTSTSVRTQVFKWIAGVATVLDSDKLKAVLHHLLAPLAREMITTEEGNAELRQLAKEVASLLKKRVGLEVYSSVLAKVQQQLSVRRAERRRGKRQLAVTDPEVYAQKKIKRHEKKKEVKKRKLEEIKGKKRKVKRRKVVDLENDEVI